MSSTASDGDLIRTGALGDNTVNLVVQYEYTPALGDVDGYSYGGRAQAWLGDHVRVGISGMKEETGAADNHIIGADIHVRLGLNSYVEAEIAQSEGPGFGRSFSDDGGLTINSSASNGVNGRDARAYSIKGQVDLSDINSDANGVLGAYFEHRERNFSSLDYDTSVDQRVWGVHGTFDVVDQTKVKLKYEDYADDNNKKRREGQVEIQRRIDESWTVSAGVKHTDQRDPLSAQNTGRRTEVGGRLDYKHNEFSSAYIFGQVTADKAGTIRRNDRGGVGGQTRLTDKIGIKGEVSYGTTGIGGLAAITYDPTADDHYYVGYRLDPDRAAFGSSALYGSDLGNVVFGMKRRHNDVLSTHLENSYDMFGEKRALTTTYGVNYTPDQFWSYIGGVEFGELDDPTASNLERIALSGAVGYNSGDGMKWNVKAEARFEDSADSTKDRNTYLFTAGFSNKVNDEWRMLGNIDALISDSNQSDFRNGDYIEGSLGFAYRPVDNDRFNALVKYTYLEDLPGADQVTVNGTTGGPRQKSHIFSADASYDINERLTIGAKYGFRISEVSVNRTTDVFTHSSAHLGILRADYHIVKKWDALLEARVLASPSTDTVDYGALAAIYYHAGKNMKVGVGYNFGSFSDDLRDLTHDDGGVFLNVIGKF